MFVRNRTPLGREIVHSDFQGFVDAGEVAEVPDHVGSSLIEQVDVWEEAAGSSARSTVDEVLEQVGDNADRARTALALEHDSERPRKSLISRLEEIVANSEENG